MVDTGSASHPLDIKQELTKIKLPSHIAITRRQFWLNLTNWPGWRIASHRVGYAIGMSRQEIAFRVGAKPILTLGITKIVSHPLIYIGSTFGIGGIYLHLADRIDLKA